LDGKGGEVAVREEGNFEFVETADISREAGERIAGQIQDLERLEEVENLAGKFGEVAREFEPSGALVLARPESF
jgi:hypothetical protein